MDQIVSEELESEHIPGYQFCNVHPSPMFNRLIGKQWSEIENNTENGKINPNFLVNVTTNALSVSE